VALGVEGEEALKTDDGLRLVGMMIKLKEKGATLTWALDLPVSLEARSPLLLLLLFLLLLLVPLGEITPRWWWWRRNRWWWWWRRNQWWWWRRRDRRADVPLRAVGLGARLLGPAWGPLALLGRLRNE
jgi:hypothetical protein